MDGTVGSADFSGLMNKVFNMLLIGMFKLIEAVVKIILIIGQGFNKCLNILAAEVGSIGFGGFDIINNYPLFDIRQIRVEFGKKFENNGLIT